MVRLSEALLFTVLVDCFVGGPTAQKNLLNRDLFSQGQAVELVLHELRLAGVEAGSIEELMDLPERVQDAGRPNSKRTCSGFRFER